MDSGIPWTINLGCWNGVHVRMHVSLPLTAIAVLLPAAMGLSVPHYDFETGLMVVGLLLTAVTTHAMGHIWHAARRGTEVRELILAPWGEWEPLPVPSPPEAAVNAHLAGIGANLCAALLTGAVLIVMGDDSLSELIHPFGSRRLFEGDMHWAAFRWAFWLNYVVALVNLLPIATFDGSRLLRGVVQIVSPEWEEASIDQLLTTVSRAAAILCFITAYAFAWQESNALVPVWLVCSLLGMLALFAPIFSRSSETPTYEEPMVRTTPRTLEGKIDKASVRENTLDAEPFDDGPFALWMQERKELQQRRKREQEESEERLADDILARVHEFGMQTLSLEDRAVLDRVSARLRRRLHRKV